MNKNRPRFFEPPPATAKAAFVSGMAAYDGQVGRVSHRDLLARTCLLTQDISLLEDPAVLEQLSERN
jgi:hypothetical protein